MSDIVDNRREKLVDVMNRILDSTQSPRFAVGYFFVSGLTAVREKLEGVEEVRLLIGNTSNRETIEQMAEGYRRLEVVAGAPRSRPTRRGPSLGGSRTTPRATWEMLWSSWTRLTRTRSW